VVQVFKINHKGPQSLTQKVTKDFLDSPANK
jgi:hypothetical protein